MTSPLQHITTLTEEMISLAKAEKFEALVPLDAQRREWIAKLKSMPAQDINADHIHLLQSLDSALTRLVSVQAEQDLANLQDHSYRKNAIKKYEMSKKKPL